ncbi:C-terminal binding protein [Succinatimonas hippei]|uniref:C-terminal binding protein n=1 Tax=Succinatimonas hippei TaxID=626938 RepID=UPI0026F2B6DF|nr:C-terminal binding protein [Succinatimonas hippei]
MADTKIFITDCDHANINEEKAVFDKAGIAYKLVQCKTEDDVIANCQGAVAVCNQYAPLTDKVFSAIPTLKTVVRYGVGVDNVDLVAATKHGVQVCNVPDYGTFEVADQALALMMAITRKVCQANTQVKEGRWDYAEMAPIARLSTITVGIIGLGRIGLAFAHRVHALGCKVIGYDIYTDHVKNNPEYSYITCCSEEEVLKNADVISLHCGLNAQNAKMMNAKTFGEMKKGAMLINVARGGLVDEAALADALKSGHLGGAGIDVTCKEPLEADSPLRSAPNIVITPHMAWYSVQAASDLKTKCAEEAVRGVLGEKARCPVNKL